MKLLIISVIIISLIVGIILFLPKIINIMQKGNQVSPLSEQCAFACESGQKVAFCDVKRKVNNDLKLSCETLAKDSEYSRYNIKPCPAISC